MWFINNGGPVKIRIGIASDCNWATIQHGERIELPKKHGKALGLSRIKTTIGSIGSKTVETKQIDTVKLTVNFFKELCSIKGIGVKTAKDIIRTFPERGDLKTKIQKNENLPFRDDVEKLLKETYGS